MTKAMSNGDSSIRWNVLADAWLEVVAAEGCVRNCSPLDALRDAARIRALSAASPLDEFAAMRFLLTLVYWKAGSRDELRAARESFGSGRSPPALLDSIAAASGNFELLDDRIPFLQDPSARDESLKSAGSLFSEFACGTNIAHFHHGDDDAMRLCLPCVTAGMVRVVPWTQSGGAGLTPTIHNAPPIVAMAVGASLAETLSLNLVELHVRKGKPVWSGQFVPTEPADAIPYMEAFTWNPRRIYLPPPQEKGECWRCGERGVPVVGQIVCAKNPATRSAKQGSKSVPFAWQDPAAFYGPDAPYITAKSGDERRAAFGDDLARLGDEDKAWSTMVGRANASHSAWRLVVPCTNPANNKTFDHRVVDRATLSPESFRGGTRGARVDEWPRQTRESPPPTGTPSKGAAALVRYAVRYFTPGDWAVLAAAAHRSMEESAEAFDLFAGLYWSIRDRKLTPPSRGAAWLVLKLMASVPARARLGPRALGAAHCPLDQLPRRQPSGRATGKRARPAYPVAMPLGQRLEAALYAAVEQHLRRREPLPIDWVTLCHRLDRLPL